MSAPVVAAPSDDNPPPLSEAARIVDTFIAPSKTFTDIRRNGSWWAPWLLISIFSLAFIYTMGRQIGFEQISRNQVEHSARADQFDKLPPDQQEQRIQLAAKITRYIAYATPFMALLAYLIMAAILMATFKVAAGAALSLGKSMAIVIYSSLPYLIHAALGIISLFAGVDREGFNINNPVASNPAYFMDLSGNKFLYGMASALDVFVIWSIVLMGIGFACNSKIKRSKAILIVAGWYLLWKLVISGVAAL
jgi:Yip1 domain